MRRPFFRADVMTWYVQTPDGKQHNLGRGPRYKVPPVARPKEPPPEVQKKSLAVMQRQAEPADRTLSFCMAEYLGSLSECTVVTRRRAEIFQRYFLEAAGDIKASKLRSHHADAALKGRDWKPNSIGDFIARIHACLNCCERKGWIATNPLQGKTEKPKVERREAIMLAEDRARLIEAAGDCYGPLLRFLEGTGCRPIKARSALIEKCDLEEGVLLLPNKTRKKTGSSECPIFLSTRMIELCREAIGGPGEGAIFLNSWGTPWTKAAMEKRTERLVVDLGITHGKGIYNLRRAFASTAINDRRMNPAHVAIQLGHSDLKQLMKTDMHSDHEAMRRALDAAGE